MLTKNRTYQLQSGDFTFQLESDIAEIDRYLQRYYPQHHSTPSQDDFIDYRISLTHSRGLRRFFRSQVNFSFNHQVHFNPLPLSQAPLALEWGMNWVIATQAHQYLIIHAASLEKEGKGIIVAAPSGSGKSTLCAYLVSQGWRLLSDEHALVERSTLQMPALARPINLKNQSIDIIKGFYADSDFSLPTPTHKGAISLLKPPPSSPEPVQPRLLVFVQYDEKEPLFIEPVDKASALMELIKNSFNFSRLNTQGFVCAKRLVEQCDALYVEYNDLAACERALTHYLQREAKDENPR